MPRINFRERRDKIFHGVLELGAGEKKSLPHRIERDESYILMAVGLQVLDESQEQERAMLQHLIATPFCGEKSLFEIPGIVCAAEREVKDLDGLCRVCKEASLKFRFGYVFARPLTINSEFSLEMVADDSLPFPGRFLGMLFGMISRSVG